MASSVPENRPLPTPEECVRRAWERLCDANQSSAPLSTVAVLYAESQAWAALAVALNDMRDAAKMLVIQSTPQSPTSAPTLTPAPKRKLGRPPAQKIEPPDDPMAKLRAKWQQDQGSNS